MYGDQVDLFLLVQRAESSTWANNFDCISSQIEHMILVHYSSNICPLPPHN